MPPPPAFRVDEQEAAARLGHPDIRQRGEAFALLVSSPRGAAALEAACRSPDGGVRASAALALGNRGEARGILLEMASDPEAPVRSCALGALAHVGMEGAEEKALAGLADGRLEVRRAAATGGGPGSPDLNLQTGGSRSGARPCRRAQSSASWCPPATSRGSSPRATRS